MLTVTFRSILWGVATLLGVDPTKNLQANQAAAITEYINVRLKKAWEPYAWPFSSAIELRQCAADYDAATAYGAEDIVYFTEAYYRALGATTGNLPTNETFWEAAGNFNRVIPLAQSGETVMNEVVRLTKSDPRLTRNPGDVGFWLSAEGVQLSPEAPARVWVEFSKLAPRFTASTWNSATAYLLGDLVYLASTGECYEALGAGTNQDPATVAAFWAKVDFPAALEIHVKWAAFAECLLEDGQADKALRQEGRAQDALNDEYDKLQLKQGQLGRFGVATR